MFIKQISHGIPYALAVMLAVGMTSVLPDRNPIGFLMAAPLIVFLVCLIRPLSASPFFVGALAGAALFAAPMIDPAPFRVFNSSVFKENCFALSIAFLASTISCFALQLLFPRRLLNSQSEADSQRGRRELWGSVFVVLVCGGFCSWAALRWWDPSEPNVFLRRFAYFGMFIGPIESLGLWLGFAAISKSGRSRAKGIAMLLLSLLFLNVALTVSVRRDSMSALIEGLVFGTLESVIFVIFCAIVCRVGFRWARPDSLA